MDRLVTIGDQPDVEQPLFVELVNTLHWDDGEPIELIGDRAGLAAWLEEHGLPGRVEDAWLPALWSLREHARSIIKAVVAGQVPADADIEALRHAIAEPNGRLAFVEHPDGRAEVAFQVIGDERSATTCQIALSLAAFLATGDRLRLKLCANPSCGFAFLDTSTNRSRRWCFMRYCGNRLKARAFRRRRKAPAQTPASQAPSSEAQAQSESLTARA
jgi:predicted RNA-binding Zn ribbon-like protein